MLRIINLHKKHMTNFVCGAYSFASGNGTAKLLLSFLLYSNQLV